MHCIVLLFHKITEHSSIEKASLILKYEECVCRGTKCRNEVFKKKDSFNT